MLRVPENRLPISNQDVHMDIGRKTFGRSPGGRRTKGSISGQGWAGTDMRGHSSARRRSRARFEIRHNFVSAGKTHRTLPKVILGGPGIRPRQALVVLKLRNAKHNSKARSSTEIRWRSLLYRPLRSCRSVSKGFRMQTGMLGSRHSCLENTSITCTVASNEFPPGRNNQLPRPSFHDTSTYQQNPKDKPKCRDILPSRIYQLQMTNF